MKHGQNTERGKPLIRVLPFSFRGFLSFQPATPTPKTNMADYFTNFSLVVRLPDEAAQTYALTLAQKASRINQGDEAPADFPAELQSNTEDWCFDTDVDVVEQHPGLWLHSSNGGIDAVCAFLQHLLKKFDPTGRVTFQWSNDCSKPRVDAYGGGAAIITARKVKTMSTCEWLCKHAR